MAKETLSARFRGPRKGPLTWFFFGADDGIRTHDPHLGKKKGDEERPARWLEIVDVRSRWAIRPLCPSDIALPWPATLPDAVSNRSAAKVIIDSPAGEGTRPHGHVDKRATKRGGLRTPDHVRSEEQVRLGSTRNPHPSTRSQCSAKERFGEAREHRHDRIATVHGTVPREHDPDGRP